MAEEVTQPPEIPVSPSVSYHMEAVARYVQLKEWRTALHHLNSAIAIASQPLGDPMELFRAMYCKATVLLYDSQWTQAAKIPFGL